MNLDAIQEKLLAAARAHPPGEQVPYAFEKRIMARLASVAAVDDWTLWGRALWRAAVSCLAIMLLSGAWTLWSAWSQDPVTDFSQDFETAVFAMADTLGDAE